MHLLCAGVDRRHGRQDPGEVVMDEFAAQALTFLAVPLLVSRNLCGWESLVIAAFGFLVFRVFDILKPGPIRKLERFPAGWGVLADDLVRRHGLGGLRLYRHDPGGARVMG